MKKILIDANPIVPYYALGRNSGIGRTCMELISQLDRMRSDLPFEIELYTQNMKGISASCLNTGFKTRHVYLRNTTSGRIWSRRLHVREMLSHYDFQHITHNFELVTDPSRCIVTLHDAFFMKLDVRNFDYASMREQYPPFIRKCKHIITCSEYSKKDIIELIGIPEDRVTVIPWGIDHNIFYEDPDKESSRQYINREMKIERPYFLSVSCDTGRKRTQELIKAYLSLRKPENDLVLVWANPPDSIKSIVAQNPRIHLLSGISNEALRYLYNGATASVNPTSYEGFGLPILEAMACGCPVVTCANSSIPEIGGDAVIYLEEPVGKTLPYVMRAIDVGEMDLADMSLRGLRLASNFTWERTAEETIEVYKAQLGLYTK